MTIGEMKIEAYDAIAAIEYLQSRLKNLNAEIAKESQKKKEGVDLKEE